MPNPIDPETMPAAAWLFEVFTMSDRVMEYWHRACTKHFPDYPEKGVRNGLAALTEFALEELEAMMERRVREACECCSDKLQADVLRQPDARRAFCENELARTVEHHGDVTRVHVDEQGRTWRWVPEPIRTDDGEEVDGG